MVLTTHRRFIIEQIRRKWNYSSYLNKVKYNLLTSFYLRHAQILISAPASEKIPRRENSHNSALTFSRPNVSHLRLRGVGRTATRGGILVILNALVLEAHTPAPSGTTAPHHGEPHVLLCTRPLIHISFTSPVACHSIVFLKLKTNNYFILP